MLGINLRSWVMSGISKYQEIPSLPHYDLIVPSPIAMMELTGIGFDVAKHKRLILSWQNEKETLEAMIL